MTEAVAEHGEHELTLAGTTYLLRPSRAAISVIERKTGQSLVRLARSANLGDISSDDTGVIVAELVKAGAGKDEMLARVSADKMADLCYEEGAPAVMARLALCLSDAAKGGRTASGEAKAGAAPPTEGAATGD